MPARRRQPPVLARDLPAELQVAATNGSIVTDSRGRKYIDFVMGWCVGNFGWCPAAIAKAVERFKGPDYVLSRLLVCARGRSSRGCSHRWPHVR
jgi:4-aminobutyrate aminotransferase-like enzyme